MVKESSKYIVVKPIPVSIGLLKISISNRMGLIDRTLIMFATILLWIGRMGWMGVILENRDINLSSFCIMRWRRAKCSRCEVGPKV
jgi:hypothetical protein